MKCGGANLPDAVFCGKCSKPFGAIAAVPIQSTLPPRGRPTSQPEPDVPVRVRGRTKNAIILDDNNFHEAEADDDDPDSDGRSLDYVPQIDKLEIEELSSDPITKVSLDGLLAQGQAEAAKNAPKQS